MTRVSEPVEAMARAIDPKAWEKDGLREVWAMKRRVKARKAAKRALLSIREATEDMIRAGRDVQAWEDISNPDSIWQAMVDEAVRTPQNA